MDLSVDKISEILGKYFNINSVEKDLPFGTLLPQIYRSVGLNIADYFYPGFFSNYLGLMIKNSENVKHVYGTVFLNNEIINNLVAGNVTYVLIFTHHPMEDETSDRGFLPLQREVLLKMKENRISVYSLHSPLDYHSRISTPLSFGKAMKLKNTGRFSKYLTGYIGIYGELEEVVSFNEFLNLIRTVVGVSEVHFSQNSQTVNRVGIIPGGGTDLSFMHEVISLGCDTYLTGEYYSRLTIPFGDEERRRFNEVKSDMPLNMVEASHYATEKLVMVNEIADFFKEYNIPYKFIEQDNPWY